MRATILAAGGLACAGAAMTIAAFAGDAAVEPETPAPKRDRGADVFAEQGCGGCHVAGATDGAIGPDLTLSLHGRSRDYVIESIVLPDQSSADGWSPGMMPDDFARRIKPDDLQALATYLMREAASAPR